jgi:hypothetical protein
MKREVDENFSDYCKRRKEDNKETRQKLKGILIWNSSTEGTATDEKLFQRRKEIYKGDF